MHKIFLKLNIDSSYFRFGFFFVIRFFPAVRWTLHTMRQFGTEKNQVTF